MQLKGRRLNTVKHLLNPTCTCTKCKAVSEVEVKLY